MKNAIKLSGAMLRMAISAIVLAGILAAATLSLTACDNGTTSGGGNGNKILGLSYSMKFEYKSENKYDSITNPYATDGTIYILEHSFEEAYAIVAKQLGSPREQQIPSHFYSIYSDYVAGNPGWVALEDEHEWGSYRLVHKYRPDDPNDTITDGYGWYKPFEQEGTLRITNIPDKYNGEYVRFDLGEGSISTVAGSVDPTRGASSVNDLGEIKNGSVELLMWWHPSKKRHDRSGTYNGQKYDMQLYFIKPDFSAYTVPPYRFPVISFTNGNAELDFQTGREDPNDPSYNAQK